MRISCSQRLHIFVCRRVANLELPGNGCDRLPLLVELSDGLLGVLGNRGTVDTLALVACALHTGLGPFTDERTLELGKASHDGKDHLALGGSGVDVLLIGEKVHTKGTELVEGRDQRLGGSGKPIIAPD